MSETAFDTCVEITCCYQSQDEPHTGNVLAAFSFLLSDNRSLLERAIYLVDDQEIIKIQSSTTERHFWLLKNSSGSKKYRVLDSFCPCRYFFDQFRRVGKGGVLCKHIVAILIARSLHKVKLKVVPNEEFVGLLTEKPGYYV